MPKQKSWAKENRETCERLASEQMSDLQCEVRTLKSPASGGKGLDGDVADVGDLISAQHSDLASACHSTHARICQSMTPPQLDHLHRWPF